MRKGSIKLTVVLLDVVCGFEAFINGKHIVGEVKEKEQAHKEYREAISQGHGAYLMDEETPVCHVILGPVIQRVDNTINRYPVEQVLAKRTTLPVRWPFIRCIESSTI